jgi:hypothetical protein
MNKIRYGLIAVLMSLCLATSADAQLSIGIGLPNVSIGINLPLFPELVPVPGYPVYYAPQMDANYFFYDGMYWVYQDDNWYASSWYNGPWGPVRPEVVPLFILRIPVRYYRQPPAYFRGWQANAPPRWGQHWGRGWEQQRSGWNNYNRGSVPKRAPLPAYQRQYSGDRYPHVEQQQALRSQSYRYQPRDKAVQQHYRQLEQNRTSAPEQRRRQDAPAVNNQRQPEPQRQAPHQQGAPPDPRTQPPQRGGEQVQRSGQDHNPSQQSGGGPHDQQAPRAQGHEQKPQDRGAPQEQNRDHGQGQGQGQNRDDDRGRGRDK